MLNHSFVEMIYFWKGWARVIRMSTKPKTYIWKQIIWDDVWKSTSIVYMESHLKLFVLQCGIVSFCNALQTFDARLDHAENGISDRSRVGQEIAMESYCDSLCSVWTQCGPILLMMCSDSQPKGWQLLPSIISSLDKLIISLCFSEHQPMTLARKAAKLFSRFLFLNPGEVYILFSFVTNGHTSDDFPCRSSLYWELEIFILWRFIALFHVLLSESYEFHSNFLLFWLSGSFASKNGMGIKADLVRHQHFQYITKKNLIACIHINYSFSETFEICSEVYM